MPATVVSESTVATRFTGCPRQAAVPASNVSTGSVDVQFDGVRPCASPRVEGRYPVDAGRIHRDRRHRIPVLQVMSSMAASRPLSKVTVSSSHNSRSGPSSTGRRSRDENAVLIVQFPGGAVVAVT